MQTLHKIDSSVNVAHKPPSDQSPYPIIVTVPAIDGSPAQYKLLRDGSGNIYLPSMLWPYGTPPWLDTVLHGGVEHLPMAALEMYLDDSELSRLWQCCREQAAAAEPSGDPLGQAVSDPVERRAHIERTMTCEKPTPRERLLVECLYKYARLAEATPRPVDAHKRRDAYCKKIETLAKAELETEAGKTIADAAAEIEAEFNGHGSDRATNAKLV